MQILILYIILAAVVIISVVLHEVAHGYVALLNGDATAKANGRLTLNPAKHFDLFGFLMLLLVRFGYAKPVPVNPNNFRHRKTGVITVSLAGITANFLLAFFSMPFTAVDNTFVSLFFSLMVIVNVNLMLFNLLPFYPLDGYRFLEGITRCTNRVTKFMRNYGQYILIVFVGFSFIANQLGLPIYFDPIGLYISYVGGFIENGIAAFWKLFGIVPSLIG